eukprot:m.38843 g.38843  ORF g.38843 m.38843 type:complete len:1028 (+) comp9481_c0_seq1:155-3238(+)
MMMNSVVVECFVVALFSIQAAADIILNPAAKDQPLHSIGAQSTAGTARLLVDYPKEERDDILDLLFKPNYGASLQHLKVEIGGDAQISCGAESSFWRTQDDMNLNRGYEHWLMQEAKKRNPNITLLGLVYAWPSWISNTTTPWADNTSITNAARYVTEWVIGSKQTHNLSIDWVGCWNEREYSTDYIIQLRQMLDAHGLQKVSIIGNDKTWDPISKDFLSNSDLRASLGALSQHYPNGGAYNEADPLQALEEYGVPLFSSEDYSCVTDDAAAAVWGSRLNGNFVGGAITLTSAWHLVSAFYSTISFYNQGLVSATQPWSGNYYVTPTLWVTAHTTQFTTPGMHYLKVGNGSGYLSQGGTYVSLIDGSENLTIILEKAGEHIGGWAGKSCNGGLHYTPGTSAETVTLQLAGELASIKSLYYWKTVLNPGGDGENATYFQKQEALQANQGNVIVNVAINSITTLTTFNRGFKGNPIIPPTKPFPLPYADNFEAYNISSLPKYVSSMNGAFEVTADGDNKILQQTVAKQACCNFIGAFNGLPYALIGSSVWENIQFSASLRLESTPSYAFIGVRGKQSLQLFQGGLSDPSGVFLVIGVSESVSTSGSNSSVYYKLVTSVSATAGGICSLPACFAHGILPVASASSWINVTVGVKDNVVWASAANTDILKPATLPSTVGQGGGFAVIGSSYAIADFNSIAITNTTTTPSRCSSAASPRSKPTIVGCGEAEALSAMMWTISNKTGAISLDSTGLCLAANSSGLPPASNSTPSEEFDPAHHGKDIVLSSANHVAQWPNGKPGATGCDEVALIHSPSQRLFSVIVEGTSSFVDVGFCDTGIDMSGKTWMGWQAGKAWVYRHSGLFKTANGHPAPPADQGVTYGSGFNTGDNVTGVIHNQSALEFLLNGVSQGFAPLDGVNLPADVVPCVGGCAGARLSLIPQPLPRTISLSLAPCANPPTPLQTFQYSFADATITHPDTNTCLSITGPIHAGGDFANVELTPCPSPQQWYWSSDRGFIRPNFSPENTLCMAACL